LSALTYLGLFLLAVCAIGAAAWVLVWAAQPPGPLDDELSRVDRDTDRAELNELVLVHSPADDWS